MIKRRTCIFTVSIILCLSIFAFVFTSFTINAKAAAVDDDSIAFLKRFTAIKANITKNTDSITFNINSEGAYLQSPNILAEKGTQFSVNLTIKSTIAINLKNDSSANSIRIYFKTKNSNTYTEDKFADVQINPNSDFTTYYINLASNANAKGVLSGFRIAPNCTSGSIDIRGINFDIEDTPTDYAGIIESAELIDDVVIVKGLLNNGNDSSIVELYITDATNLRNELIGTKAAATLATNNRFEFRLPCKSEDTSYISSYFICAVGTVPVSKKFKLTNWHAYANNPYQFDIKQNDVSVLDYGAKGDGFTNDTLAIQRAIDAVSNSGGGKIIVNGDDSALGKRYVVTSINLKSNTELHIEENAVLMQSRRSKDYAYSVTYNHDIVIAGAYWTHAALCANYPMLYANNVSNIKVSGKGTLRMDETGRESLDNYALMGSHCSQRIHIVPIGIYISQNISITDITIERASTYHIAAYSVSNMFVGGVDMVSVADIGGDGISVGMGANNIKLFGNHMYVSDDAIVLWSTSVNEKRGTAWFAASGNADNRVSNIDIESNFITGGHGVTFITWGSDADNISLQEITDIRITDNVIAKVGNTAIAGWFDNPYYGASTASNGFSGEGFDYSPIKNVTILGNKIFGYSTFNHVKATNVISDIEFESATDFSNKNFERSSCQMYYDSNWISGLSYWSYDNQSAATFATDGTNHYGTIDLSLDNANLYQGFKLNAGDHIFQADVKSDSSAATMFVRNSITNQVIAEQKITSTSFGKSILKFNIPQKGFYQIGIARGGALQGKAYIDNAKLTSPQNSSGNKYFTQDFTNNIADVLSVSGYSLNVDNGGIVSKSNGIITSGSTQYDTFDLKLKLKLLDTNFSSKLVLRFAEKQYDDKYYYSQISYEPQLSKWSLSNVTKSGEVEVAARYDEKLMLNYDYELTLKVAKNSASIAINGIKVLEGEIDSVKSPIGRVSIINSKCKVAATSLEVLEEDSVQVTTKEYPLHFESDFESDEKSFDYVGWGKDSSSENSYLSSLIGNFNPNFNLNSHLAVDILFDIKLKAFGESSLSVTKGVGSEQVLVFIDYLSGKVTIRMGETELGSASIDAFGSDWTSIGISFNNNSVALFVNGKQVMTANANLVQGELCLIAAQSAVSIDNLQVAGGGTLALEAKKPNESEGCSKGCSSTGMVLPTTLVALIAAFIIARKKKQLL